MWMFQDLKTPHVLIRMTCLSPKFQFHEWTTASHGPKSLYRQPFLLLTFPSSKLLSDPVISSFDATAISSFLKSSTCLLVLGPCPHSLDLPHDDLLPVITDTLDHSTQCSLVTYPERPVRVSMCPSVHRQMSKHSAQYQLALTLPSILTSLCPPKTHAPWSSPLNIFWPLCLR